MKLPVPVLVILSTVLMFFAASLAPLQIDERGAVSDYAPLGALHPLWSQVWGAYPGKD